MSKYDIFIRIIVCLLGITSAALANQPNADATTTPAPQDISCATCHACTTPTVKEPCLKPCPYANAANASVESPPPPTVVTIGVLSDLYEPVVFNHERHAQMSQMGSGCVACHHYTAKGHTPACQSCHGATANAQNLRQPGLRGAYHRQCLGCHREWTGEASCGECHAERRPGAAAAVKAASADIVGLKHPTLHPLPAYVYDAGDQLPVTFHHKDHTELFGLKCSDCHQKESCSSCHNTLAHVQRTRTDPHEDCARCHQEWTDNNCAKCHSETPLPNFNHAQRTGFDLAKFHQALSCERCHEGGVFGGLTAACSTCHAKDWKPANFEHKRTGTVLDDLHVELECTECHAEFGKKSTCSGCHDTQPQPFETFPSSVLKDDGPQTQKMDTNKN